MRRGIPRQRMVEAGHDRDPHRRSVEEFPRIATGAAGIDDTGQGVASASPDETVRGLAEGRGEPGVGEEDRGEHGDQLYEEPIGEKALLAGFVR